MELNYTSEQFIYIYTYSYIDATLNSVIIYHHKNGDLTEANEIPWEMPWKSHDFALNRR